MKKKEKKGSQPIDNTAHRYGIMIYENEKKEKKRNWGEVEIFDNDGDRFTPRTKYVRIMDPLISEGYAYGYNNNSNNRPALFWNGKVVEPSNGPLFGKIVFVINYNQPIEPFQLFKVFDKIIEKVRRGVKEIIQCLFTFVNDVILRRSVTIFRWETCLKRPVVHCRYFYQLDMNSTLE